MLYENQNMGALSDWITFLPGQKTVEKGQSLLEKYAPWLLDKKKTQTPTIDPKWFIYGGIAAVGLLVVLMAAKKK